MGLRIAIRYDSRMNDPFVSIVVRSYNEGWALRETLPAIRSQRGPARELIVIDSGSTDGSVEMIRRAAPRHFIQMRPEEYHPPRVLNLGMRLARAEHVIFLNADATPVGRDWLAPLAAALQEPGVAAVFGRQIPRPDCRAVFAADYERCFGERRESARWDHFFSMVSSGIRREIWARRGFNEAMQYSEDDEFTRWAVAQGHRVVYVPESVVVHSHNYSPAQAARRGRGEGRALAAVWGGSPRAFGFFRTVLLGGINDALRDLGFCLRNRRMDEWPHALRIRWSRRRALLQGFREGWSHYRAAAGGSRPPIWAEFGGTAQAAG